MSSTKKSKWNVTKSMLVYFLISFVVIGIFTFNQNNILESEENALSFIEKINTSIQRLAKLELENNTDKELLYEIDGNIKELREIIDNPNNFSKNDKIVPTVQIFINNLTVFQNAVSDYYNTGNRDELFQVTENNYKNAIATITIVKDYVNITEDYVSKLEFYFVGNAILIALLLAKILFDTNVELKHNMALSEEMFIDTSTGLYNRSKCQEIFKGSVIPENQMERAIIVFDLNDLKKTNDKFGHRAGDDLISSFAGQLKLATNIFPFEVFVGRYGGDEFIVNFTSIEEKDVISYLKEVDYLLDKFNNTQDKQFKLSCASGYCITNENTKSISMRELFDIADANMYQNKIAMKENRRRELEKKGIKVEDIIDDRLQ